MRRFPSEAATALTPLAESLPTRRLSRCLVKLTIWVFYELSMENCLSDQSKDGRVWDEVSKTPYFNYVEEATNTSYQVWYDDPESLSIKYKIAEDMGLGGVGFWTGNYLDYSNKTMVEDMWSVVPSSSHHRSVNVEINAK